MSLSTKYFTNTHVKRNSTLEIDAGTVHREEYGPTSSSRCIHPSWSMTMRHPCERQHTRTGRSWCVEGREGGT
ncbi:expressed protein [Echinococcus multilocularis]|uniref:Expressed protein n=1 Tax=Echinococcus multilocularis TaxID=6211 RepID=A0A068YG09_ECHMU|nr:expressed protein [Echinococcus multilocularis]